jgi:hypothetical protein
VEQTPQAPEQHPMNRRLRIIAIPRKEPDLKLLAQALIALVEEQRAAQAEAAKPKPRERNGGSA